MSYWLLKTEPETYSFERLLKENKTAWDGVRNFQARKFLTQAQMGDTCLIYHSGDDRQVVGLAEVTKTAYPDPDPKKPGDWVKIDLKPIRALPSPVTLADIKKNTKLKDLMLIRQSRLSVMPVPEAAFNEILRMGKASR